MADNNSTPSTRGGRAQRKLAAQNPAAEPSQKAPRAPRVEAPTVVETSASDAKVVAKSLRDGGATPSATEILFAVGGVALAIDVKALQDATAGIQIAEDPGLWFGANRAQVRSVVFAPAQPKVLRATPLLGVRSEGVKGASFDWPVTGHLPGLHLVVGGTGAGKSEYIRSMRPDIVVRWGEPYERFDDGDNVIHASDLTDMLASALVLASAGFTVVVDGFRELVFGIQSAAGAGGVSVGLYSALTSINNICAQQGLLICATVNPLSDETKALLVYQNLAASVAGLTQVQGGAAVYQTARTVGGRSFATGTMTDNSSPVSGFVQPRATDVPQPTQDDARVRLESNTTHTEDTEVSPARTGARMTF